MAETARAHLTTPLQTPQTASRLVSRRQQQLLVLGLVVLAAQLLWLLRPWWLAHPGVRQVLTPVVAALGHDLERPLLNNVWQTREVDLLASPDTAGAWQVRATLEHSARILQPWPALRLELRDDAGMLIGTRLLQPADYLPTESPPSLLEGDQPVRIQTGIRQRTRADGSYPVIASASLTPLPR